MSNIRFLARITGFSPPPLTKHYAGLPAELTGGKDMRGEMSLPSLLVIEQKPDGIFLYRYTLDQQCVGDTWHQSIDEAKDQAAIEYHEQISAWHDIPPDVSDVIAYAKRILYQH